MRIYIDKDTIQKKGLLGRRLSMAGLIILGAGMLASFAPGMIQKWETSQPALFQSPFIQWTYKGGWLYLSMAALIFGFILGQIGNHYMRRFLRPRRPDMVVAQALKGFDDRNRLYVWASPIDLVFAGPAGVFAITSRDIAGEIEIVNGSVKTPFSLRKILFFFGDESPGRPLDEAKSQAEKLTEWLTEELGKETPISVRPLVIFTNEKAKVTAKDADVPVIHAKQLKQFLKNKRQEKQITKSALLAVIQKLDEEAERRGVEADV